MNTEKNAVILSLEVLSQEAQNRPEILRDNLQKYLKDNPTATSALLRTVNAASQEINGNARTFPAVIGQPIKDTGIPFGTIKATNGNKLKLYLIPDYLRDTSGKPVELNAVEAINAITTINGGVRNGTEQEISRAVLKGKFKSGSYILARRIDLEKIVSERGINPALEGFNNDICGGNYNSSWCVSSTEPLDRTATVRHIRLRDGNYGWYNMGEDRSRVVLLQGFTYG